MHNVKSVKTTISYIGSVEPIFMRKVAARIILLFPTIVCAFYGPVHCTVGGSGIDAGDTRVRQHKLIPYMGVFARREAGDKFWGFEPRFAKNPLPGVHSRACFWL